MSGHLCNFKAPLHGTLLHPQLLSPCTRGFPSYGRAVNILYLMFIPRAEHAYIFLISDVDWVY